MVRLVVREFNPNKPVIARKKFNAGGKRYHPGDLFDWRKLAVSSRRVRQMYEAGYLHHGDERPTRQTVRQSNMAENSVRRDADISNNLNTGVLVNDNEVVDKIEEVKFDKTEDFPKHAGGPWYELSNGDRVRGREAAEEAQAKL